MTRSDAEQIVSHFVAHLAGSLYTRIALDRRHYDLAFQWMRRFDTDLRALDALHLAAAAAEQLDVLTGDAYMAESATRLGIKVRLLKSR